MDSFINKMLDMPAASFTESQIPGWGCTLQAWGTTIGGVHYAVDEDAYLCVDGERQLDFMSSGLLELAEKVSPLISEMQKRLRRSISLKGASRHPSRNGKNRTSRNGKPEYIELR
jgi:hypothetical protein